MNRSLLLMLSLLGCQGPVLPDRESPVWADVAGDPIEGLTDEQLVLYEQGREVMSRAFSETTGLGPTFNADSCAGCHQFPVGGGSGPRYRDFWLVKADRGDGVLVDAGTNGVSPVRNLYATGNGHIPEVEGTSVYARRSTPNGMGVGLFAFVSEAEILTREDAVDRDGDGISGRPNYEGGQIGRFGYKSQATSLESFNRGAMFNQMGITSNPIDYSFPNQPVAGLSPSLVDYLVPMAWAQVAAPDQPTVDDDGVPDPEMTNEEQTALLVFSTYLAPLRPAEPDEQAREGAKVFRQVGCDDCHTPALESTIGKLYAYTDLLLHDMGPAFEDDLAVGLAGVTEFRTAPLWNLSLHGPFLHDGRAETVEEAIAMHGGEGSASADAFGALDGTSQAALLAFLGTLGGWDTEQQNFIRPGEQAPGPGENGGPVTALAGDDLELWLRGRRLFDRTARPDEGLGPYFNADSCRACHQDPVLGGAGGADTSVIRYGNWTDGVFTSGDDIVLPRVALPGVRPLRLPNDANVVELRNPLTTLGVGEIDAISELDILAGEDPDDVDGDGISGRARIVGGMVGRYGWKAQIATASDFAADALIAELGQTVDASLSTFTGTDEDSHPDPELSDEDFLALSFYLANLGAPVPDTSVDLESAARGEARFLEAGCDSCHSPSLGGVPAYSDLLLHDMGTDVTRHVDQDPGVSPTEYRTPPLWGVRDTAPYLHDGSAPGILDAVLSHGGEGSAAREAVETMDQSAQQDLVTFLLSL